MVGSGCSVLPRVCYADNSNSTRLSNNASTVSPAHPLCEPALCHFSCLSTRGPFSSSLCVVSSFHFTDHPTSSHSAVSVSHSAFPDDEEFSDFIQGPVEPPRVVPAAAPQPLQPARPGAEAGQRLSPQAVPQPGPPAPGFPIPHAAAGQGPYFPTSASSPSIRKTGNSNVSFLFNMSPSVIELLRVFICFLGLYFSLAKRSNTWAIK